MSESEDQRGDEQGGEGVPPVVDQPEQDAPEDDLLKYGDGQKHQEGFQLREEVELRPRDGIAAGQRHEGDDQGEIQHAQQQAQPQISPGAFQGKFQNGTAFRQVGPYAVEQQGQQRDRNQERYPGPGTLRKVEEHLGETI